MVWQPSALTYCGVFYFMPTSKLQRKVSEALSLYFGQYTIRENTRPDWLITPDGERLELDFYIEEIKIAVEVQGKQHYEYVPHFHGDNDGYKERLRRDRFKKEICESRGIVFIEIFTEGEIKDCLHNALQISRDIDNDDLYFIQALKLDILQTP